MSKLALEYTYKGVALSSFMDVCGYNFPYSIFACVGH